MTAEKIIANLHIILVHSSFSGGFIYIFFLINIGIRVKFFNAYIGARFMCGCRNIKFSETERVRAENLPLPGSYWFMCFQQKNIFVRCSILHLSADCALIYITSGWPTAAHVRYVYICLREIRILLKNIRKYCEALHIISLGDVCSYLRETLISLPCCSYWIFTRVTVRKNIFSYERIFFLKMYII